MEIKKDIDLGIFSEDLWGGGGGGRGTKGGRPRPGEGVGYAPFQTSNKIGNVPQKQS